MSNEKVFLVNKIIDDLKVSGKHEAIELIDSLTNELETMMENMIVLKKIFDNTEKSAF